MKRYALIAAASLLLPFTAAADVTVMTPRDLTSKEQAILYVARLDSAVRRECMRATGPVIGVAWYAYRLCLKHTREAVEKSEPTGLYAARGESPAGTTVAAR